MTLLSDLSKNISMRGTKADCQTWAAGLDEVVIAYATDTAQLGVYSGGAWAWFTGGAGVGDMLKATYDTDDDGIVDNADQLDSHDSTYFATASHTHASTQYEVVMADGEATPTPLTDEDETDWLYGDGL